MIKVANGIKVAAVRQTAGHFLSEAAFSPLPKSLAKATDATWNAAIDQKEKLFEALKRLTGKGSTWRTMSGKDITNYNKTKKKFERRLVRN